MTRGRSTFSTAVSGIPLVWSPPNLPQSRIKLVEVAVTYGEVPTAPGEFTLIRRSSEHGAAYDITLIADDPTECGYDQYLNTDKFELGKDDILFFAYPNTDNLDITVSGIFEQI